MDNSLTVLNNQLKKEADEILQRRNLLSILQEHGHPHISGSYELDLMTWRDLDIYLEVDKISIADFFDLGTKLANALMPLKMSFRNEVIGKTKGLPNGLYWGIYLGNERLDAWKIDIWAVEEPEIGRLLEYSSDLKKNLTPEISLAILDIKSQCWKDPSYRKTFTSTDIYDAVINKGVRDIEDFTTYLQIR